MMYPGWMAYLWTIHADDTIGVSGDVMIEWNVQGLLADGYPRFLRFWINLKYVSLWSEQRLMLLLVPGTKTLQINLGSQNLKKNPLQTAQNYKLYCITSDLLAYLLTSNNSRAKLSLFPDKTKGVWEINQKTCDINVLRYSPLKLRASV